MPVAEDDRIERKLTTILAADVEGYSRLMAADEVGAMATLRDARAVFARLIERHRGRIANTAGDGLIADFPSAEEAASFSLAATAGGSLKTIKTTPLLTVDQGISAMQRAAEAGKDYVAPVDTSVHH